MNRRGCHGIVTDDRLRRTANLSRCADVAAETHSIVTAPAPESHRASSAFELEGVTVWLGERRALRDASFDIPHGSVTALMGAPGCGKSACLRALNRMNETLEGARTEGRVRFEGRDVYAPSVDVTWLRRRAAMVLRAPQMLPGTVFDNVAFGPRLAGASKRSELEGVVERALARAGLWTLLRDRLHTSPRALSRGDQQRLCVARALALEPAALLLDEPAATLDPVATATLEETLSSLRGDLTVVIVTHAAQQAARVAQHAAFFHQGGLVEVGETRVLFTRPRSRVTQDFLTGRFG